MTETTLGRAVDLCLNDHIPTTASSYRYPLVCLLDALGGDTPLARITPENMLDYARALRQRAYAPATLHKHLKTIKVFFNWCVKLAFIPVSPAVAVKVRRPTRLISRDKAMTDKELDAILDVLAHKTIPRDYALVLFIADSGCRRGGATGLRLKDLDFERRIGIVTEKGDKTRQVAFSARCAEAIKRWLTYRERHNTVTGEYVFSRSGEPMLAPNVSLMIRRTCKQAGIRTLSSHSLRHRKGHQFADARIAPSLAATYLGHSDVLITLQSYYPADFASAEQAGRELMGDVPFELPPIVEQQRELPPIPFDDIEPDRSDAASSKIVSMRNWRRHG